MEYHQKDEESPCQRMHCLEMVVHVQPEESRDSLVEHQQEHDRIDNSEDGLFVLQRFPFHSGPGLCNVGISDDRELRLSRCISYIHYVECRKVTHGSRQYGRGLDERTGMFSMKMIAGIPVIALGALVCLACGAEASGEEMSEETSMIEIEQTVSDAGPVSVEGFVLTTSVDGDELIIEMTAPTTGWLAVGFEPSMAMKDADMIIGYVADGEVFLSDDWGDGPTSHKPDTDLGGSDDVTIISGSEENGLTTITFSRPLVTGDGYDRDITPGGNSKVLLAYGREGADDFEGYHAWAETLDIVIAE